MTKQGFSTKALHVGQAPDPATGAVVTPITLSTTFAQSSPGAHKGYEYSRSGNPTRLAYETCIASLENAKYGLAFASGLAAEDAIMRLVDPGKKILLGNDSYGGTYRLLTKVHSKEGRGSVNTDITDHKALSDSWDTSIGMLWFETPTNPMLTVNDIRKVCLIAHKNNAIVVVDNTFATPYLQNPLDWGADIVVHSATKYIAGHSDVIGGFVALSDPDLYERLHYLQNAVGGVPSPFDCYLALRGAKTLALRMEKHCDNAERVVEWLRACPQVSTVLYPEPHPQSRRQGGMVSFRMSKGEVAAKRLVSETNLFTLAESLGAVESLIEHPYSMTHASSVGSRFEVPSDLVRLSVGIEDIQDLLSDLSQAFAKLK